MKNRKGRRPQGNKSNVKLTFKDVPTDPTEAVMDYDPKLRQAAAEIKSILATYQIAGIVGLASKTHAEFLQDFPEWSCVKEREGQVFVRCKREQYDSEEAQHAALEQTTHSVCRFQDIAVYFLKAMTHIRQAIEAAGVEVVHNSKSGFTPFRRN